MKSIATAFSTLAALVAIAAPALSSESYRFVSTEFRDVFETCYAWTDTDQARAACQDELKENGVIVLFSRSTPAQAWLRNRYPKTWGFCEHNQDHSGNPNAIADNICEI